ncbi:MAG: RAMP superfamily CRISPR-associated protein [Promethearchaeota archaeon]
MHKFKYNSIIFHISIIPKSPILIKSGIDSPNPTLPDMQFVRTHHLEKGETIYIPGSSLKGVIRSHIESLLRTLDKNATCDILEDSSCTKKIEENEKIKNREFSSSEIYSCSCKTCKVFGNGKLKSRISILDAYPEGEIKMETRNGVAISRLTHAVAAGPFDMEVLIQANLKTKIFLENFECWQIGFIALAINSLNTGFLKLGFGKNRGFGVIEIKIDKISYMSSKRIEENEIWGLGNYFSEKERNEYGINKNDKIQLDTPYSVEIITFPFIIREFPENSWNEISSKSITKLSEVLN